MELEKLLPCESLLDIQKIGYLPENAPLYDNLRIYEYLEYAANIKGISNKAEEIKRVVKATHLEERINSPISELSKGYRQRVCLADALLGDPEILILDEPTSGLDPNQAKGIRNLIREIGKTKTVVFSTHILQEVNAVCDRVLIINEGSIAGQGTVDELVHQAQGRTEVKVKIEGSTDEILRELKSISGVEEVTSEQDEQYTIISKTEKDICRDVYQLCVDRHWTLLRMQTTEMSLEDVFSQLTK